MSNTTQIWLRWMLDPDLPIAAAIERASFPYPWSIDDLRAVLQPQGRIGLVVGMSDLIVGFIIYEMVKRRMEVIDFAVSPGWRRRGIGHQMILKLINRLDGVRRTQLGMLVRESNLAGQLFLRHEGFHFEETLHHYYPDSGEDGYRLVRGIHDTEPVPIGGGVHPRSVS